MLVHKEDYINIVLMLFSCVLAFMLPFELFLFSYAILGPLHYLTEISWLHQRNYFSNGKRDYSILVVLCFLSCVGIIFQDVVVRRRLFEGLISYESSLQIMRVYGHWFPVFAFAALVGSIGLIAFKKMYLKIAFFVLSLLLGCLIRDSKFSLIIIGMFLPTLVHVYVFTGLFMLYGALKSRSIPGYMAVLVLVGCTLSFYFIQIVPDGFSANEYVKNIILKTGFRSINVHLIGLFKSGGTTDLDIFDSSRGLMVQRFIAFAYTYHYLNWFSKTEIIKWHLVPRKWLIGSIVLWIASIALYVYDFRIGMIALFYLSMLHVFLEFPLNVKSILGIGRIMLKMKLVREDKHEG